MLPGWRKTVRYKMGARSNAKEKRGITKCDTLQEFQFVSNPRVSLNGICEKAFALSIVGAGAVESEGGICLLRGNWNLNITDTTGV